MQKDYIMRIVEQFIKAVAAIICSRKAENYDEASEQIKMASRFYLKTDISLLTYCPPERILELFRTYTNDLDTERCVLSADLLYEMALIKEAKQFPDEALRLKISCLYLYVTAIPKEEQFQTPAYREKVAALIEELKDLKYPDPVQKAIDLYLERSLLQ